MYFVIFQGRDYCFVSNIDNLGATVDLNILNVMASVDNGVSHEFLMEITSKTKADVKVNRIIILISNNIIIWVFEETYLEY